MTLSFEINFLGLMYGYVAMDYAETWLYLPFFLAQALAKAMYYCLALKIVELLWEGLLLLKQ